jgi:hypothetical protein
MRFKYRFADLECHYCLAMENEDGGCPYDSCPHITENLKDLLCDPAFIYAVSEAENCDLPHRPTLLILKEQNAHVRKTDEDYDLDEKPFYGYKPECLGCPYPRVGFICFSEADGSCLKTDMAAIGRRQPIGRSEQRAD